MIHPVKQLICVLPLILLALDEAAAKTSQCRKWYLRGNPSGTSSANGISPVASTVKVHDHKDLASFTPPRLVRRITPAMKFKTMASGPISACGNGYNTQTTAGVCLWTGSSNDADTWPGWLNGANTENCNKQVWVKNKAGVTRYATVIDGCSFKTTDENAGCSSLYVTEKLFQDLGGNSNPLEISNWDFTDPAQ